MLVGRVAMDNIIHLDEGISDGVNVFAYNFSQISIIPDGNGNIGARGEINQNRGVARSL